MFKLERLYSEPKTFDPIVFRSGLNLILGETKEDNQKTNGVGKSLAVDFLSFALLKKFKDCRISLIPKDTFDPETKICLEFSFRGVNYLVKRSPENHNNPEFIQNGISTVFASLDDATEFFSSMFVVGEDAEHTPSFRAMLGPLIRDEKSEFKSLVLCHDTNKRIPADYTPHLFLLHIEFGSYREIKALWAELDAIRVATSKVKENIETLTGKNLKEAKAELNELTNQIGKIQSEIDNFENLKSYEYVRDELVALENQIEVVRTKQSTLKHEISKTRIFGKEDYIPDDEIEELYEQFKRGLGTLIQKQLEEVLSFKHKIDEFQRSLLEGKREALSSELGELEKTAADLDRQYKDRVSLLDQNGSLKNLKQSVAIQQKKMEDLASLSAWMRTHTKYELEKSVATSEKNKKLLELKFSLQEASKVVESIQESILQAHEYIAGNRHCSFEVEVTNNREVVKFDLRIHDDGSHSNEREKVFMYDVSLLLNNEISPRHLGFLVHDNIFDVDQDTLVKSLNFLTTPESALNNKQYVLTINEDKFRQEDLKRLRYSLSDFAIARYTKKSKFLKRHYQEVPPKKTR
ncbi:DUF2326 domain-containing protein [Pseudomonas fluorescens]|uniref:DUF2326 domain-containing protein n=1 Tax=Pseudomonas fluorescens TaxID=294 RepID=A0A0D0MZP8_PSEFL|nr:DUF2326 domain-containing protein [Pseudomonas fluorescens]KIQ61270.1 hypothetical protein RL74_01255 [Pseudomonas fluorescens]